jgi:hypothetical protein
MQLASSGSKDSTRVVVEFPKEPVANPVFLEKVLRRHGLSEFRGYSGVDIPDSEVDVDVDDGAGLQVETPSAAGASCEEEEDTEEETSLPGAGEEDRPKADEEEDEVARPHEEEEAPKSDRGSDEEEGDEYEEEDDARSTEIEMLVIQLAENQRLLDKANPYMRGKYQSRNADILGRIEELQYKGGRTASGQ